jgi:hypothetical protein
VPADNSSIFPSSPGVAADPAILLDWITRRVPLRSVPAVVTHAVLAPRNAPRALVARKTVPR